MLGDMGNKSDKLNATEFNLDALHKPDATAAWLQISERTLLNNVRLGRIPCVAINKRVLRFHPRTILAAKGVK